MSNDEMPLARKFIVRDDISWQQLLATLGLRHELKQHGKFLQVVVSTYCPTTDAKRVARNRKMWKAYLEPIAAQARMNGYRVRDKDWHLLLKIMFLPEVCAEGIDKWKYLDNGDRELTMSTGDLNDDEHAQYLHEIGSYAATELGVRFPANPRDI